MTVPLVERATQELTALRQYISVAFTQLLEQACRAFNICEEQRDGSCREVLHGGPPQILIGVLNLSLLYKVYHRYSPVLSGEEDTCLVIESVWHMAYPAML